MKKIAFALAAFLCVAMPSAKAQKLSAIPSGVVIYSLPSTTVSLVVTAEKEDFIAGPYAAYAQKYMGAPARTENSVNYTLKTISMIPYIEADPSEQFTINLGKTAPAANFLQMCSQGLVVTTDSYTGKPESWRFPSIAGNEYFSGKDIDGNLTNATTTLYKTVKTDNGFEKVSVSQKQVVEKSLERKAEETAAAIFNLRRKRVDIITGDTDATYSGEAMDAAIKEMTRLEQEYMSLFYGVSAVSEQTMTFDVMPKAGDAKQMYVAFRISETAGLLPANNVSGRPILLELTLDEPSKASESATGKGDNSKVFYRVPATVTARILDGQTMLMQTRMPVYQLGQTLSFPISTILK
ncbi:MAG: DUF4831 family protein [Bacteroidales bacterium]|nr:DUF4831 family protein [Bacteroidales bacterium]